MTIELTIPIEGIIEDLTAFKFRAEVELGTLKQRPYSANRVSHYEGRVYAFELLLDYYQS